MINFLMVIVSNYINNGWMEIWWTKNHSPMLAITMFSTSAAKFKSISSMATFLSSANISFLIFLSFCLCFLKICFIVCSAYYLPASEFMNSSLSAIFLLRWSVLCRLCYSIRLAVFNEAWFAPTTQLWNRAISSLIFFRSISCSILCLSNCNRTFLK